MSTYDDEAKRVLNNLIEKKYLLRSDDAHNHENLKKKRRKCVFLAKKNIKNIQICVYLGSD